MGALLRFKQETGHEAADLKPDSLSDMCVYLWCCVASASRHDGVEFGLSLMDFADSITPEDLTHWATEAEEENRRADNEATCEGEEKKR